MSVAESAQPSAERCDDGRVNDRPSEEAEPNWANNVAEPAWRAVTDGESRWPATVAIGVAIALQLVLPHQFAIDPWWLIPGIEAVIAVGLLVTNPIRIDRHSAMVRNASMMLIAVLTAANTWSAVQLVKGLVNGSINDPSRLLWTGGAIWLTNVIAFSLWYWELDRGGPGRRSEGARDYPDFMFAQMASPNLAPADWEPNFWDYFYVSFTNATAFSPTDVLPLSRWAKFMMMIQSGVSLVTVALVVARAVNILK